MLRVHCRSPCKASRCSSGAYQLRGGAGLPAACCAADMPAFCLSANGERGGDITRGQCSAAANAPSLLILCFLLPPCNSRWRKLKCWEITLMIMSKRGYSKTYCWAALWPRFIRKDWGTPFMTLFSADPSIVRLHALLLSFHYFCVVHSTGKCWQ